jgi:hypothetical protein
MSLGIPINLPLGHEGVETRQACAVIFFGHQLSSVKTVAKIRKNGDVKGIYSPIDCNMAGTTTALFESPVSESKNVDRYIYV